MDNKCSLSFILNQPAEWTSGKPAVRSRRKHFEVHRIYKCIAPGCDKSYGTLNHLNTHVRAKGHGKKRDPIEFVHVRRAKQAQEQLLHSFFGYTFYSSH
ncbi:hypothetical protein DSO57_1004877 [Entomophthora muscae]|uniref:Uncharacterized protein n=2 Tax=Entomophthora muscae TaxID=34485 RepID=A0ACC2TQS1_9FUNG|nr:hypothetical protein DSO57_1024887 [Entomophthora muscae]KAJ9078613.1 hypothetical protein DSO57_1004877 [Entomophthora muscae]